MIRGLDEELAAHKYSHVERERRFLVDADRCPDLTGTPTIHIEDRYVIGTRFRLRRMTDVESGRVVLKLSKKYDVPDEQARPMVTAYLADEEYSLFERLPARPVAKHRHTVVEGAAIFGIDVFAGALSGLMLAEIECPEAASLAAIVAPSWTSREVTADPTFQGGNLATFAGEQLGEALANLSI